MPWLALGRTKKDAQQNEVGDFFETASETIKAISRNLFKTFHCRGARLGAQ